MIIIEFLIHRTSNPSEIPVSKIDQPLYAISTQFFKQLQQNFTKKCRQESFVRKFGQLYIEMAIQSTLRDLVEESGWTTVVLLYIVY